MSEKADRFLELHRGDTPLLMPNAWDAGSAKLFASLGAKALATTSSGHAATLGRLDGSVTRDEAIAHSRALVAATPLPVSADLENGYADEPGEVAETVRLAIDAGLAGCSIEDYTGNGDDPIYNATLATERVAAAADAAHSGPQRIVLTARCENYLHGRRDLAHTIARLEAYRAAGADVVFAPGLHGIEEIRELVAAVDCPVNVLALPGVPPVAELAEAGVARVSVGGAFAFAAYGAAASAARELLEQGTYGYFEAAGPGIKLIRETFGS